MKRKSLILAGAIVLAMILFIVSTSMQKKLINYEPKVECLFIKENIKENSKLSEDMFYIGKIDISLVASNNIVKSFEEIQGLYSKDNLYKGQIAISKCFATKEELSIYEIENGKERISIKLKNAENGVSYSIKPNSKINVYVTLRSELANNFLNEKERLILGTKDDGYTVIKIIENVTVLDLFDIDGVKIEDIKNGVPDSLIIAVTPEEAKVINLLREIGTFNITGIGEDL